MVQFIFEFVTSALLVALGFGLTHLMIRPCCIKFISNNLLLSPNAISIYRIILGPVCAYLSQTSPQAFLYLFIVGCISDYTDGVWARATSNITKVGKFLDPLGDKVFYLSVLWVFQQIGYLSPVTYWLFVVSETFSQFSRPILVYLNLEMAANRWGKWKATLTFFLVYYLYVVQYHGTLFNFNPIIAELLFTLCLLLSVMSSVTKFLAKKLQQ
ncbi:MAG: CDP-alcohol phosphatidyltransferase family protein [Patescibacteria group bacterium]